METEMRVAKLFFMSLAAAVVMFGGPAFAITPEEDSYRRTDNLTKAEIDSWSKALNGWLSSRDSYDQTMYKIKYLNDSIVSLFRTLPCRDSDQARSVELYIHQKFHELYSIAPDITHGVNMSCNGQHKLVPTLWITKFTLKKH
jgi:hypothetical protein